MKENIFSGVVWHSISNEEVLERLQTSLESGLDLPEVEKRQKEWGLNVVTPKKATPLWMRYHVRW